MKTLMIVYSLSGKSRAVAQKYAKELPADLQELRPLKPVGVVKAYTAGIVAAMRGKPWPFQPIQAELSAYDCLHICAPVWAANVPPFINELLTMLPSGKEVHVTLTAGSGVCECQERLAKVIAEQQCELTQFEVRKSGS